MWVERIINLLVALLAVLSSLLAGKILETGYSNASAVRLLLPWVAGTAPPFEDVPAASNRQGTRVASVQLLAEGRYQAGRAALETLPPQERSPLDWMRLAMATAYAGDLDQALVYADYAHIPTDTLVRWGRGSWIVLQGKDDPVLANLWFTAASARSDGSWGARRDLGTWWLHRQPEKALWYLEPIHAEHPEDTFTTYLLALAFAANGAHDRAVELGEEIYARAPSARNCNELARLYLGRNQPGDRAHAVDLLSACLTLYPGNAALREQLSATRP